MSRSINDNFIIPPDPPERPSFIAIIILLVLFWPVGLFLGFKRFTNEMTRKRYQKFRRYAVTIGSRTEVSLRELASTLNMPVENLIYDIQAMIDQGMIRENAYIDHAHKKLYLDKNRVETEFVDRPINVYVTVEDRAKTVAEAQAKQARRASPQRQEAPQKQEAPARKQPQPRKSATDDESFEAKLREIRRLNEEIQDKAVSERIDRIGELTASIFRVVQEKPERAEEVRKFMNYYLPTTLKLLKSYSLMEKQSYQGENIIASRKKIEDVMDTLIQAFEQQLDRLFRAEALDVDADISVLETMMASDGLIREKDSLRVGGH